MIFLENIRHAYKDKEVLKGLSLQIKKQEIFGLLGPNGSGKTTLFRILSTAMTPSSGKVSILGFSFPGQEKSIREKMGIVFQSPSLDGKLTVQENLKHHGHLYGISGKNLIVKSEEMMQRLGVLERKKDRVEKLSGGLKRRVELAKALLHDPQLLILDEPSTGLDPGARVDLWKYLRQLQQGFGTTILVTTHLMDEAEHCSRIAVLNQGQIVALGTPRELKQKIRGEVLTIQSPNPEMLCEAIQQRFGWRGIVVDRRVQLEHENGAEWIAKIAAAFEDQIESITIRKPTLEDVFMHETGHRFWEEREAAHV